MKKDSSNSLNCSSRCGLLTTVKAHPFMTERHGVISEEGCNSARGRGFKQCEGCPSVADSRRPEPMASDEAMEGFAMENSPAVGKEVL